MARNPFEIRGTIRVRHSATVICARRRPHEHVVSRLTPEDCGGANSPFLTSEKGKLFGAGGVIEFRSGWEVMLGQAEVVDWLKTTPGKLSIMRYAGEWKLAGGNVDPGETVQDAAARELSEEFLSPLGIPLPDAAVLRLFSIQQTRPIRSTSNLMHCFIALEDENPWLSEIDVAAVNAGLEDRRREFSRLSLDPAGNPTLEFYSKSKSEREAVTPEVHEVAWLTLRDAVGNALSSMSPGSTVNSYQKNAFRKYGRQRRDPMFITAAILMELEAFPDAPSVVEHCDQVDPDTMLTKVQWLFDGMTSDDVVDATRLMHRRGPVFKGPDLIAQLRKRRKGSQSRL